LTRTAQAQPNYLRSARAAARWIVSRQSERHWPSRPDTPLEEQVDLYYGNAGMILFFRELAESTGEQSYLEIALTGAAYIADQIDKVTTSGLYRGLAGMTFALDQMRRTSEDRSLLNSLNLAINRLQAKAKECNPGVSWNESNDLFSGTAGIGLALIHFARQTGRNELRELAKAAGDRLLALAHDSAAGNYWTFSANRSTQYPNFSHGTAGVGYFLAELSEATHDERYRVSALAAGRYLRSIVSKAASSNCLIFHDDVTGRDLFYLGWCHGPAGTGRFFYRLYQLTDDPSWLDLVGKQATTLMASGIPERQTPGYWNNVSRCCGAAGVGEFFIGLYTATKDRSYLAFAEHIAVYLIARAETDANGMKWTQAERRIEPDYVVGQTGLMQGAAGVGLFLVHVDEACCHKKPLVRFPDEPLWEEAGSARKSDKSKPL
jgi:lantibiotic modifying enzyme